MAASRWMAVPEYGPGRGGPELGRVLLVACFGNYIFHCTPTFISMPLRCESFIRVGDPA